MKIKLQLTISLIAIFTICIGMYVSFLTASIFPDNNQIRSIPPVAENLGSENNSSINSNNNLPDNTPTPETKPEIIQEYKPEVKTEVNSEVNSEVVNGSQTLENIYINSEKDKNDTNKQIESKVSTESGKELPITQKKSPRKDIPILYYHAINDTITGIEELFVSPKEFEKQMEFLKNNGYTVITFDDIPNISKYEKPVIITFDDGYQDNYTYAYPTLKRFDFKATVFLAVNAFDKPLFLNKQQIEEMKPLINFQSHTMTHPYLTSLNSKELETELSDSKTFLENLTGAKVNVLAYPIGDYNQSVIDITRKYYTYAVVSGGGIYHEGDNSYEIRRVYIPRELNLDGFIKKITRN